MDLLVNTEKKTRNAKGAVSKHKIFSTVVFLNGDKAVEEIQVMMLSPRINIKGCFMYMTSPARIFARLVMENKIWRLHIRA